MKLRELLKDVEYKLIQGNLDIDVKDIAYDSFWLYNNIL